jgi:hypothetical protein
MGSESRRKSAFSSYQWQGYRISGVVLVPSFAEVFTPN